MVAYDKHFGIGANNDLLWQRNLPADLKHFKDVTTGGAIIMGRNTYDSIGKPLPNRQNIVITRSSDFSYESVFRAKDLSDAVKLAGDVPEIMIIGGGSIYEQAIPIVDKIYLTRVHHAFEGDVFFPKFDLSQWSVFSEEKHIADKKSLFDYSFIIYVKIT